MRHILEAVYDFLVVMVLVTGAAICQTWDQSLNSLEIRITERGNTLVYSVQPDIFSCCIFWGQRGGMCIRTIWNKS